MKGMTWDELAAGFVMRTQRRTITEWELMSFVTMAGFLEPLFIDAEESSANGRLVPAALTFTLAEGLVISTGVLHGTGIAFLGANLHVLAPVYVGNTITVEIEVTESRATSDGKRGIVVTHNQVIVNDQPKLWYDVTRMVKGSEVSPDA